MNGDRCFIYLVYLSILIRLRISSTKEFRGQVRPSRDKRTRETRRQGGQGGQGDKEDKEDKGEKCWDW
jgi:hypothetical protein